MPTCTTKRRTTTNLKTKNYQNYQKIELYRSLTTKELKKRHSSRVVEEAEMGSQGREDMCQGSGWQTRWGRQWLADGVIPHSHADKPGGTTGEQDRLCHPVFQLLANKA